MDTKDDPSGDKNDIQLGNGFSRIANRLIEVIYSTNFNATQLRIVLFVIRYTYGFSRKSHNISLTFIANGTGISKRYISKELKVLIDNNVIRIINDHTTTESREISLNKNFNQWIGYRTIVPQVNDSSTDEQNIHTTDEQLFNTTDEQLFHQERKDKEKIKKEQKNTSISESENLFERLWKIFPNKKGKSSIKPATKKKLMVVGEEKMIQAIKSYTKYCEAEKSWYKPLNGSTFFNGRYEDYLPGTDEEVKAMTREIKPIKHLTQEDQNELFKQMELDRQQKNIERRERMRGEKVEHDNPGD